VRRLLPYLALAVWIVICATPLPAQWNSVLACNPGPCINGVPCRHCNGTWTDAIGGRFILNSYDSGTVYGTYKWTRTGCPEVTWQVNGTLTRVNPPNQFTSAYTTITLNATSPSQYSCGEFVYLTFSETLTLQNDGCDLATGTWRNSNGDTGNDTLTKPVELPASESTEAVGWSSQWPTVQQFRPTLHGTVSFDGRQVKEVQGFDSSDTCYYTGAPTIRYRLSGGWWPVGVYATPPFFFYTDTWIDDYVGISPDYIAHYRQTGRVPCDYSASQWMNIYTGGHSGTNYNYKAGYVGGGVTANTIYSFRDNIYVEKVY
jgi:hypothetical protein